MHINKPKVHRDLNWLSFNHRVLQEAENKNIPLYERLKFLAIFSSNLDEYFKVRVAQQRHLKSVDKEVRQKLSLKPNKTLREILERISKQQEIFGRIFDECRRELADENVFLLADFELEQEHDRLEKKMQHEIQPYLQPKLINLEDTDELFLADGQLYLVVEFEGEKEIGLINIPSNEIDRFYHWTDHHRLFICFIDDIISYFAASIFHDKKVIASYSIKLSRDAELYMDDEYDGELADKIYESLDQRETGQATRLLYDEAMPDELLKPLRKRLNLGKIDLVPGGKYHNFDDLFKFPKPKEHKHLVFKELPAIKPDWLSDKTDMFELLKQKDRLVHFPYMDFDIIEKMLEAAVNDEKVKRIRISLYRIADDSKLTRLLTEAAGKG